MDAPAELMERAKELVRSMCSRNLIPGADLLKVTVAIHDELCGASLAMLATVSLKKDFSCRGNIEIAMHSTGFELMSHLVAREKLREQELASDPIARTRAILPPVLTVEEMIWSDPSI